jgi:hypothetical protein
MVGVFGGLAIGDAMKLLNRRLGTFTPFIAAIALAVPAAAGADPSPVISGPSCPDGYSGPTNLATGCPYYLMTYTVQYPGRPAFRCPVDWNAPKTPPVASCVEHGPA